MRVLVTGASGFIGSHLVPTLAREHQVICLVRDSARLSAVQVETVQGDLSRAETLGAVPERVDAVIHLAQANVSFPDQANVLFAVNTSSTLWLADYARRAGARHFVYASSGNVYSPSAVVLREDSPAERLDLYALTKQTSERILACYKEFFNITILRLFAPYGPGQTGRMIPGIIARVREGHSVVLTNGGEPRMNPIYIDDVVAVFTRALTLEGFHLTNVAGPQVVSVREIAEMAGAALNRAPVFEDKSGDQHFNLIADTTRMRSTFALNSLVLPLNGVRAVIAEMDKETKGTY